jgi:hypothetical protein
MPNSSKAEKPFDPEQASRHPQHQSPTGNISRAMHQPVLNRTNELTRSDENVIGAPESDYMYSKRHNFFKAKIIDHAVCLQCSSGSDKASAYLAHMGIDDKTIQRVLSDQLFRNKFFNRSERFQTRNKKAARYGMYLALFILVSGTLMIALTDLS